MWFLWEFEEIATKERLGIIEFSTGFPGLIAAFHLDILGLAAPPFAGGGARNIISGCAESKRKSGPCALL